MLLFSDGQQHVTLNVITTTHLISPVDRSQSFEQPQICIARWNGLATHHYYTESCQIARLEKGGGSLACEEVYTFLFRRVMVFSINASRQNIHLY